MMAVAPPQKVSTVAINVASPLDCCLLNRKLQPAFP